MIPARLPPILEGDVHKLVADWLTAVLPAEVWFSTFPMGGGGKARGGKLRRVSAKPGVPDLLLVWQGRAYWIELKRPKGGRTSEAQKDTQADLIGVGCMVATCPTLDHVASALRLWGVPHRTVRTA